MHGGVVSTEPRRERRRRLCRRRSGSRISLLATLVGIVAVSAAFAFAGRDRPTSFRLPDASAACRLQARLLVCANLRGRDGVALPQQGRPHAVPARVWWDASTPVLDRWSHGGLSCRAVAGAIFCRNGAGASTVVDALRVSQ